jgi:hypothetical protein
MYVYCSGLHSYRGCCNSVIVSEVGADAHWQEEVIVSKAR